MRKLLIAIMILCISAVAWGGVDFNGDADYISVPCGDGGQFDPADSLFSVAMWVRATFADGSGTKNAIRATGATDLWAIFLSDTSNTLRFYFVTNVAEIMDANSGMDIRDSSWYHIVGVRDGTKTGRIYVNGVDKGNAATGGASTSIEITSILAIGANTDGSGAWQGGIAEVSYWNIALTPFQVLQLYNSRVKGFPLQIQPANLVGYWPLDDLPIQTGIAGDTFRDLSGNGNTGTGVDADGDSAVVGETILSYPAKVGNWL